MIYLANNLSNFTILHWAAWNKQEELIDKCLSKEHFSKFKNLLNRKDSFLRSLVSISAYKGLTHTLFSLQNHGLNLEEICLKNLKPIHWAVLGWKHFNAIENQNAIIFLFNQDCSLEYKSKFGTPSDLLHKEKDYNKDQSIFFNSLIDKANQRVQGNVLPTNLAFQGGGAKGIAYVGVLQTLEMKNFIKNVKRVSGTSAGAITATLISLGMDSNEIKEKMIETEFRTFLDVDKELEPLIKEIDLFSKDSKFINDISNLIKENSYSSYAKALWKIICKYMPSSALAKKKLTDAILNKQGFCKGDEFLKWIEEIISKKTGFENCTFGQFADLVKNEPKKYKHLHVCAYNTTKQDIQFFSSENKSDRDVVISQAVRASMSIPGVFVPYDIEIKGEKNSFIDGGILNNLPIEVFDYSKYKNTNENIDKNSEVPWTNPRTWGFSFDNDRDIISYSKGDGIAAFLSHLAYTLYRAEVIIKNSKSDTRIFKISPMNHSTLDLDMEKQDQEDFIKFTKKNFLKIFHKFKPIDIDFIQNDEGPLIGQVLGNVKKINEEIVDFLIFFVKTYSGGVKDFKVHFEVWKMANNNSSLTIDDLTETLLSHKLVKKINDSLTISEELKNALKNSSLDKNKYRTVIDEKYKEAKLSNNKELRDQCSAMDANIRISKDKGLAGLQQFLKKITVLAETIEELPIDIEILLLGAEVLANKEEYEKSKAAYAALLETINDKLYKTDLVGSVYSGQPSTKFITDFKLKDLILLEETKMRVLSGLVKTNIETGDIKSAKRVLKKEIKRYISSESYEQKQILAKLYELLSECYEKEKDYYKSSVYSQMFIDLKNVVNS